ncbi:flavoprotein [Streptomyces sp. NRRL S-1813]|uniref:flavoprotein n=1 Tax=Streptomyces sp. NRRL S-1813 TaxID=1463888 RepID=UPI000A4F5A61|nr:flavoprotein [Streptomyces sp. NRRL S-1813]
MLVLPTPQIAAIPAGRVRLLAREKHTAQAVTLVRHTADQLTGAYDQRSPRYLAALGLLLLRGVTAASSGGDRSATKDFLTEAKDVARYVDLDRPDAWANFSPTNVALHTVSAAVTFGDAGVALETATPGDPRPLPPADAIAVARATFNTINKWAAGISDTLAVGILCEAYGFGIPTAVLPYLNSAQAAHPAYRQSLDRLREMGVLIGSYELHKPKAGGGADRFRWEEALELLVPRLSPRT